MRSFLRVLWMGSVLLIVALASALVTIALAVHGREVAVPNVQGRTPAEAQRLSDAQGLSAKVEREYYSASVPEGKVLSQVPSPGTMVRRGWDIRLAVSLGPQRVQIPQLVGQTERGARIVLEQRGIQVSSVADATLPGATDGQVIAQDPLANAADVEAPKASFLVAHADSAQAFLMPSFAGQQLGAVTAALQTAGFSVGSVTTQSAAPVAAATGAVPQPSQPETQSAATAPKSPLPTNSQPPSPNSVVISQNPAAGQKISLGDPVNLVVR